MKYVFLYKINDTDDRDCVKYVNINKFKERKGDVGTEGACFSGFKIGDGVDYDEITTILTEDEFYQLSEDTIITDIKPILDKLISKENQELFEKVYQEEREWLKNKYYLTDEDLDTIFEEYYLDYKDRGIIGMAFNSIEEMAMEEAYSMGYSNEYDDRYFDYEIFGNDLMQRDEYIELTYGRVVVLNY